MSDVNTRNEVKLAELHPIVANKARAAMGHLNGGQVLITCAYRSLVDQNNLYAQGRTKAGKIITNARGGYSFHNYRLALDIVPVVNGVLVWDGSSSIWHVIARNFIAEGFEWGYNWAHFKEMPHFQMSFGHPIEYYLRGNTV